MLYRKNLPAWERAARWLGAGAMAFCAYRFGWTPIGVIFGVTSATTALTALFGFCPACAMAGRRIGSSGR